MTSAEYLAGFFDLLSVEPRVRILQLLKRKPACVTELTSQLGISIQATSQHLRLLRNAGMVTNIKRGVYVYYLLEKKQFARIQKAANELFKIE